MMYKKEKITGLVFSMVLLFQSCTAFKSTPITIEQAAGENIKTKIETNDDIN